MHETLGLEATWMESEEPAPAAAGTIARSYFDQTDLTPLDFSIDAFGGGGLAATTDNVARFFEALLGGQILEPQTLALMTEIPEATNLNLTDFGILLGDGASGLYRLNLDDLGTCWSHRGFLGTIAVTCPGIGATAVVTTNTALTDPLPIAIDLLTASTQP
jgi:D-alanyl-D-alanine carboxypeptidase